MQAEVPCSRTCLGAPLATMAEDGPRERREPSPRPICGLSAPCSEQTPERRHTAQTPLPTFCPQSTYLLKLRAVRPSGFLVSRIKCSTTSQKPF